MADFPDRFLMGIGIGHPEATSDYKHPLKAMREFLDGLDAAHPALPADGRCLAALGPKMLDLARERTRGTHTYFVSPGHTRFARERLGADKLVATELACVVDTDAERGPGGRAPVRQAAIWGCSNYTNNLLRFGFTEDDIADGGSDRLIDTIVPHGSAEQIAAAVQRASGCRGRPRLPADGRRAGGARAGSGPSWPRRSGSRAERRLSPAMTTGWVWHERYAWHDARGLVDTLPHESLFEPQPSLESGTVKRRLRNLVEISGLLASLTELTATPLTADELCTRARPRLRGAGARARATAGGGDAGQRDAVRPLDV